MGCWRSGVWGLGFGVWGSDGLGFWVRVLRIRGFGLRAQRLRSVVCSDHLLLWAYVGIETTYLGSRTLGFGGVGLADVGQK